MGCHKFTLKPVNSNIYLFTAIQNNIAKSIKIINLPFTNNSDCKLDYQKNNAENIVLKTTEDIQQFSFTFGDELLYIDYYETLESGMYNIPE